MRFSSSDSRIRGTTLFEITVAMLIAGVLAIGMLALLIGGLDGWAHGTSRMYAESSAGLAAQKVAQEIRDGQSASVASGKLTVTLPLESSDANGEQCYNKGVAGQVREYFVRDGKLMRTVDGAESVVLSRISAALFTVSGPSVTITVTGTEQVGSKVSTKQATARALLRNQSS